MAFGSSIDQRKTSKCNHLIDIFRRHGTLSKAMARSLSGYSMDTVISIFNSLRKQKIIRQSEGRQKSKGRKAEFYTLNEGHSLYLGVTFNQSGIHSATVSFSNRVLDRRFTPLPHGIGRKKFETTLAGHVGEALRASDNEGRRVSSVGISVPGDIDLRSGVLNSYIYMPALRNITFSKILPGAVNGGTIMVDHNIRGMSSYAIHEIEGIASCERTLFVSARSGVAHSIIAGGAVITGRGDLGHVRVSDEKVRCDCGRSGCLDCYFSYRGFKELYIEKVQGKKKAGVEIPRQIILDALAKAFTEKKGPLYGELEKRLLYFTTALMDAANITAPERIVLSGELLALYGEPVAEIQRLVSMRFPDTGYVSHFGRARMSYHDLGTEIAAIGICFDLIKRDWGYESAG